METQHLSMRGIGKAFSGVRVLDSVDFDLRAGEVHILAGENGADYLLFGEPSDAGERPSPDAIFERLQWWAELFEPPPSATTTSEGSSSTRGQ